MLIHPLSRETTQEMYPNGRKYLFDLGTGRYLSGSLPWFNAIYSLRGIDFDEVWGVASPACCFNTQARIGLDFGRLL